MTPKLAEKQTQHLTQWVAELQGKLNSQFQWYLLLKGGHWLGRDGILYVGIRTNCKTLTEMGMLSPWILMRLFDQASLVAQRLKDLPPMQETQVRSLGQEDPLEKEMATHSSILAWRIPWTEELGRLQSTGLQRVGHNWATSLHF